MEVDGERVKVRSEELEEVVLEGMENGGLYYLSITIKKSPQVLIGDAPSMDLWHRRLSHLHDQATLKLINDHLVVACIKSLVYVHPLWKIKHMLT